MAKPPLISPLLSLAAGLVAAAAMTLALGTSAALITETRSVQGLLGDGELQAAVFHERVVAAAADPQRLSAVGPSGLLARLEQADAAVAGIVAGRVPDGGLKAAAGPRLARVLRLRMYAPPAAAAFRQYLNHADRALRTDTAMSAADLQQLRLAAQGVSQSLAMAGDDVRRVHDRSLIFTEAMAIVGVAAGCLIGLGALGLLRRKVQAERVPIPPASDVIVAIKPDNAIARVSGSVKAVLGQEQADVAGRAVGALVHPADTPAFERWIEDARRGVQRLDSMMVRPRERPDAVCEVERCGNRRRDDRDDGVILLRLRDVTSQRRAEEMLRQSSEMLRTLTEASPLAIMVQGLDGRMEFWNAASQRMFGWSAAAVIGQPNPTVPASALDERRATCARIQKGQAFAIVEDTRVASDGRVVEVVLSAAPLRDPSGTVSGILEVLTDVTERKQLQAQLLQSQKMEGIGRLAGGIAHDFNNLLTAILGHAGIVRQQFATDASTTVANSPELRTALDHIQRAAERAAQMTQQLLAFSRNQVMQPTILDLSAAVTEMEGMIRPLIGEHIDLLTVAAPGLPQVKADPAQITQVLVNLVLNARDAMPDGGRLTIELSTVVLDEEYARRRMAVIPGEYVMLAVSDNGSGMDKATQAHIFEPFFSTKDRTKGTGLGLATVYGIIKQTGGYIWCYSEPGIGTTFKIYLPSIRVAGERRIDERAVPARRGSETVLLVEDEEMVRSLVKQVLTWYGYTVIEAHNGEMALRLAREHAGPIGLLITDLVMPGLAAVDLVQQLAPERPEMRVLYMSGYTDHAVVRNQLLNADVPFLQKPFAPDRLAHKVAEVLKGRGNVREETARLSDPPAGAPATR